MHISDFQAKITFLTTAEGGKKNAVNCSDNKYRPTIKLHFTNEQNSVVINGCNYIPLGEETEVEIDFILSRELYENLLTIGDTFDIMEGSRVVGFGHITEILREDLMPSKEIKIKQLRMADDIDRLREYSDESYE